MLDLDRGHMKQLSGRDPREYTFPAVASAYCAVFLLILGFRVGFGHYAFWLTVACCVVLVLALERRLRRFVDVWGDDDGLMVTRTGQLEKVAWRDIEAVENHYSSRCVVRFRRDTRFGRVLEFSLPGTDRLIGFEHPNAFWMRQRVEAESLMDEQRSHKPQSTAGRSSSSAPLRRGEQVGMIVIAAFLAVSGTMMLGRGLSNPTSARETGSSEILGCEEYSTSRGPRIVVHVVNIQDGLMFTQPNTYLRYVREACAAHAVVSWSAVLREDGNPHLVAFERMGVPGGFTEATYATWWSGIRVLWITFGVSAVFGAIVIAATVIARARKASRS